MKSFFALAGIMLLFSCQNNTAPSPKKFKTIMLKTSGQVETLPDEAAFRINLECLKPSVKAAKTCLVDESNELNQRLIDFGIDQNDILTSAVNLNKSYTWRNGSHVFEGYKSSATVYVTVKDLDKLDAIYTELLEKRNLNLGGLSYTHSKMDSLKNEAYANALGNANTLAKRLLQELPESNAEILKIGNVKISASTPDAVKMEDDYMIMSDMEEAKISRNQNVNISKGTVYVSATLFVEYLIK